MIHASKSLKRGLRQVCYPDPRKKPATKQPTSSPMVFLIGCSIRWLSSSFSRSRWHPLLNVRRPHEGIDISARRGTPVVATADGRVTFADWRPGYGYTVEIDHGNGIKTRYAHNHENLKVRVGDQVRRGDVIAHVGSTGLAKGPHVHYEVLVDGRAVNPEHYRLEAVIVE